VDNVPRPRPRTRTRACRHRGQTVRKLIDYLIAAVAVRESVPILHADADFDVLDRHTALQIHGVGS
jgi:hypothetical protein